MASKQQFIEEVTGYGYDGEGVCRVDGKVVFVSYALRGEKILGEIEDCRSSFCRGNLKEVKVKSDKRENPPCPYFGVCGGCAYQHTSYQNELDIKKELLSSQLKKAGIDCQIDVVPSPNEYSYRNKIRLFVGDEGLCLKRRSSATLYQINKCLLVSDELNRVIEIINSFISSQKAKRLFKEVVLRQEGEQVAVNFILATKKSINYQGLYLRLGRNYGIFETYAGKCQHKIGITSLDVQEFDLKCSFTPQSFHQVNRFLTKNLYQTAIDNLVGKSIVNCYSGAGVLSGVIAKKGKRVIGIELGQSEHDDAERLKDENSLFYLTNLKGDCAEVLPKLSESIDSIIVDPPRSGIDKKVVEALNTFKYKRLVYISCNSATLVRDLTRLENFKVKSVKLFDMFARTGEYEVLAVLDKTN